MASMQVELLKPVERDKSRTPNVRRKAVLQPCLLTDCRLAAFDRREKATFYRRFEEPQFSRLPRCNDEVAFKVL